MARLLAPGPADRLGDAMRPMQIGPECYPCLERLVELTVGLASGNPGLQSQARHAARQIIAQEFAPEAIPAVIANRCHRAIQAITGNADPFASRKAAETVYLARMYRRIVPDYGPDLESLLRLAAVGNAIDFFRGAEEVAQEIRSRVDFGISALPWLRRELAGPPGFLLYLADNAGEQVFDRPLVDYLRAKGWRVIYVVKGGPIQNDLTRNDLYASGLGEALEPITDTGALTVGLKLDEVSPGFRQLYETAQIILAKGMGHFETLSHVKDPRLVFLLQAKCDPVAQALGVGRRTFVFARSPAVG
jgi:uncharacterized protein with ATP-grasp and redox domains